MESQEPADTCWGCRAGSCLHLGEEGRGRNSRPDGHRKVCGKWEGSRGWRWDPVGHTSATGSADSSMCEFSLRVRGKFLSLCGQMHPRCQLRGKGAETPPTQGGCPRERALVSRGGEYKWRSYYSCTWRKSGQGTVLICGKHRSNLKSWNLTYIHVQFSSVAQLCLTLCDPMNHVHIRQKTHWRNTSSDRFTSVNGKVASGVLRDGELD